MEACRQYMCNTLKDCKPAWAWAVFTIAQQLQSFEDVVKAAAMELTGAALTNTAFISKASVAVCRGAAGSSPALELRNQLECVREGISRAVHRAKNPSQALLVVLLMRLDQVADDETSSTSAANAGLQLQLVDAAIVAMLKLVKWDALHHLEINALSSQSRSYKATAAAAYVKEQLLRQTMFRLLQDSALKMDSLPPGQPDLQYLAGWVKSADMKSLPAETSAGTSSCRCPPMTGNTAGLKSGSIEVKILMQFSEKDGTSSLET